MNKEVIEIKKCTQCSDDFPIYQKDTEFYEMMSPSYWGIKFQIPKPSLCPDCRAQRRLAVWNERNLYKRICDATGKEIISMYNPKSEYIIYDQDFWWSENWETPLDWKIFDETKTFFSQFSKLVKRVPKRSLLKGTGSINCNYTNCLWRSKDSYLVFNGTNSENSLYVNNMSDIVQCVDCSNIRQSEHCYECIDVQRCFNCSYIQESQNCTESSYLFNCNNCQSCFGCVNLQNSSYCIFNIQYTKQEYSKEIIKISKKWYSREKFQEFIKEFPQKNLKIIGSENISGDNIYNSKNIHQSYMIHDVQNIRYSINVYRWAHDCMDGYTCLNNSSRLYEMSLANKNCCNLMFCHDCWNNCQNLIYCTECKNCQDCFGCTWLVWQQYCILNRQYSPEEYEVQVANIISKMQKDAQWGEFFPISMSPFGYNESVAQQYYPLKKEQGVKIWANWTEHQSSLPKVEKIIPAEKLPHNISDIPDDILNWAIECEETKKAFRIIKPELNFYRKHILQIPRKHPDQRFLDRRNLQNSHIIRESCCHKCKKKINTTIPQERLAKIYCESCYNKEIY